MITLLIATRNANKVDEIRAILGGEFAYLTLNDFPHAPNVVEDAPTFAGNATKKAVELAKWTGRLRNVDPPLVRSYGAARFGTRNESFFVLADDSGLEVDALRGAPGVHSARFAALGMGIPGNSPTAENNAKLLRLMKDVPEERRTARFRCVIALMPVPQPGVEDASPVCYADEAEFGTRLFEGVCEGRIARAPKGRGGFGYDPLFIPNGYEQTFGELSEEVKNRLSHRGKALALLKQQRSIRRSG
jgi:XTP/dITP diphosphohydrolase